MDKMLIFEFCFEYTLVERSEGLGLGFIDSNVYKAGRNVARGADDKDSIAGSLCMRGESSV